MILATAFFYAFTFNPPPGNLDLPRGKSVRTPVRVDLSAGKLEMPRCRLNLPRCKLNPPQGIFDLPQGRLHMFQGKLHVPRGKLHMLRVRLHMFWGQLHLPQGRLNLQWGIFVLHTGRLKMPLVRFDSGRGGFDPEWGRAKMPSGTYKRKPRASFFGSLRRDDKPARRVLSRQRTTSDWHIHGSKGYAQIRIISALLPRSWEWIDYIRS